MGLSGGCRVLLLLPLLLLVVVVLVVALAPFLCGCQLQLVKYVNKSKIQTNI